MTLRRVALITLDAIIAALGFTPQNTGTRNAANGYLGLDATGKADAAQLPSMSAVKRLLVRRATSDQALTPSTSTPTAAIFNQSIDATLTGYDTTTGVLTAPSTGRYAITANIRCGCGGSDPSKHSWLYIYRNGALFRVIANAHGTAVTSVIWNAGGSIVTELTAGDTVQVYILFASATGTPTLTNSDLSCLEIVHLG